MLNVACIVQNLHCFVRLRKGSSSFAIIMNVYFVLTLKIHLNKLGWWRLGTVRKLKKISVRPAVIIF
jgi:hypothetical protein